MVVRKPTDHTADRATELNEGRQITLSQRRPVPVGAVLVTGSDWINMHTDKLETTRRSNFDGLMGVMHQNVQRAPMGYLNQRVVQPVEAGNPRFDPRYETIALSTNPLATSIVNAL